MFDAWIALLPEEGQRVLNVQLEAVSFVQHQAGGFYYREDQGIDWPNLHAATVLLCIEGLEMLRAKIFLGNENWHWNGLADGYTANGQARKIPVNKVLVGKKAK